LKKVIMMTKKMREKPEIKGKERQKPLSQFLRKMESRSEGISVPQKLVEANALVRTEDWVTNEDVSNLLEMEDSKGKFELVRETKFGNPKVIATTYTEKGDKVEFVLEITSSKHEKNVSEILEDLEVVSEDLVRKVELIEYAHRASIITNDPRLVEEVIMLMIRGNLNFERSGSLSAGLRMVEEVNYVPARNRTLNAVRSAYLEKTLRDPTFMSDPADWLNDGGF